MQARRLFILPLFLFFAAALLLLSARLYAPRQEVKQAPISAAKEQIGAATPLFPDMHKEAIISVSLTTPQTAFDLSRKDDQGVSINGQRGDHEGFITLLEQIAGIPFLPAEPFAAQEAPLLTLIVLEQNERHCAVFYPDKNTGEDVRIIVSDGGAPVYGRTDGWRIGTLLLACEGTRIQDETGKETPFR